MAMTSRRTFGTALAGLVLLATACGDSNEDGLEQLIEQQTGEDVEIDIGDDGFTFETDEGSVTVDEEGNIVIIGEDGEVITGDIDVDGDGINVQTDDGSITFEGDGEAGSFEFSDDDGSVTFGASEEFPEEWPADVPPPTGLDVISGATFSDGTSTSVTVIGTTSVSPADYLGGYGPMLEAVGFERTTNIESEGNVTAFYENPLWFLSYSGSVGDDGTTVNISVTSADN